MDKAYFQELYDYNYWGHHQVWQCLMQLSEAQFRQVLAYSIGSLYTHCVHVISVEYWWFRFLKEGDLVFIDDDPLKTRRDIRAKWNEVEAYVRAYLDTLDEAELKREVLPPFWEDKQPVRVWQAILQVANHGTDHRSQMLAGLHKLGGPTIEQDYLNYIFEK